MNPEEICQKLDAWARAADVHSRAGGSHLAIYKSDLLNRLMYGGEKGPSQTPCPVHKGEWSGIHWGWPGQEWINFRTRERTPAEVNPRLQEWHDQGCRCYQHKGSDATTGWQPDEHCGCV